jgi:ribonuclease BN (tRNA processing enzyme)
LYGDQLFGQEAVEVSTKIVFLGTGTPNADPYRSGPATAVTVGDTPYLFDAGPGIVRRAAGARRKGVEALRVSNLRTVFMTHLHSDHTLGYPDLIFTPWVLERDVPLQAYGPPGLKTMTDHILGAYEEDISLRLNGLEPANPDGYKVEVHEILPGFVYRDSNLEIEAFAVPHGSSRHSYGYKVTTSEGLIVISGDTGPFEGLVDIAKGADVLIYEAYATKGWEQRDSVWQRYHALFHTSGSFVGKVARQAGVATVILTHQLLWSATEQDLIDEVRDQFGGRVISGQDLDIFDLKDLK